jgi:hypothetical protein
VEYLHWIGKLHSFDEVDLAWLRMMKGPLGFIGHFFYVVGFNCERMNAPYGLVRVGWGLNIQRKPKAVWKES